MVLKSIELKVQDFMTPNPIAIDSSILFPAAVAIMANKGIGNLIITEGGIPVNILTEREILSYLVRKGEIPVEPVKDVLSQSFVPILPTQTVLDAAKIMILRKKRLLVLKNEKLVGIITASDMLKGFRKTGGNPPLDKVASKKVYECANIDSIFTSIKLMYTKRIGSVIVTKDGSPDGIFTERDLLVNVITKDVDLTKKIKGHYSSPLVTAKFGIRGNDAAKIMASNKIKRLALTDGNKIIAVVTARDIVEAFYAE